MASPRSVALAALEVAHAAKRRPRTLALAFGLLAACATVPPEQLAREEAMWAAARQCQSRFATIASIEGIDTDGRLRYTCLPPCPENTAFVACYHEHVAKTYRAGAISLSGHLATASRNERRTEVPVVLEGNAVYVPVFLNGTHAATLLLDTGATMTLLRPALAQELLVNPARGGLSTVTLTITGGQTVSIPAGRLRSIRVGSLVVEDLDVGIYDALPARQDVHGLLGGDFLRNFRVTVDRGAKRLILEVPG
jgi:predicted aspartyl protease